MSFTVHCCVLVELLARVILYLLPAIGGGRGVVLDLVRFVGPRGPAPRTAAPGAKREHRDSAPAILGANRVRGSPQKPKLSSLFLHLVRGNGGCCRCRRLKEYFWGGKKGTTLWPSLSPNPSPRHTGFTALCSFKNLNNHISTCTKE